MAEKDEPEIKNEMNFVGAKLQLPLFLVSRNRYKYAHPEGMRKYINKRRQYFLNKCDQAPDDDEIDEREPVPDTATIKKWKHVVGFYGPPPVTRAQCAIKHAIECSRSLASSRAWELAPNRYNVPLVLFFDRKGEKGAHWAKLPKKKTIPTKTAQKRPQWKFYELQKDSERMTTSCHKYKGIFLSNVRHLRPTTRLMVSNLTTCYRNPKDPGPTRYIIKRHELAVNVTQRTKVKPPNPHNFLPNSCVPAKRNSVHTPHISFLPGPGRYETRYQNVCHCSSRLVYAPGIQLIIEREKRFKFRRLQYIKFKGRRYCCPDWRHVIGNGHTYLFKNATPVDPVILGFKPKKTEKTFIMFPDARYINMVNNPLRSPLAQSDSFISELPVKVTYNCIAKRIVRRQLRNNKKIAFLSGLERFPDAERPPILTVSKLEEAKSRLPPERQLRDHTIMRVSESEIKSKLSATPQHMMPAYELELRKRLFKFLPLPRPKVLVTDSDTHSKTPDGTYLVQTYFGSEILAKDYLKPGAVLRFS